MPDVLVHLEDRYPNLRVQVTEKEPEDSLPALSAGDFDLVLGEEYPDQPLPGVPGADRETLLLDPLELAVPARWGRVGLADVADRPFAMEPEGTTSRRWAVTHCRSHGFEPDVRYTSTDLQVHLRLVEHGLAAALLPQLAHASKHHGVTAVTLDGHPARRVFLCTRTGAQRRPALKAVVDALHSAARGPERPEGRAHSRRQRRAGSRSAVGSLAEAGVSGATWPASAIARASSTATEVTPRNTVR